MEVKEDSNTSVFWLNRHRSGRNPPLVWMCLRSFWLNCTWAEWVTRIYSHAPLWCRLCTITLKRKIEKFFTDGPKNSFFCRWNIHDFGKTKRNPPLLVDVTIHSFSFLLQIESHISDIDNWVKVSFFPFHAPFSSRNLPSKPLRPVMRLRAKRLPFQPRRSVNRSEMKKMEDKARGRTAALMSAGSWLRLASTSRQSAWSSFV